MKILKGLLILLVSTFVGVQTFAQEQDGYDYGYDYIVKELSSSRAQYEQPRDMLSTVMIHGGVGMTSAHLNLNIPNTSENSGFMQGFEANLGIDLFSRYWLAEGAVRSYTNERFGEAEVSLNEFDLRIIRRSYFGRFFHIRAGFGLAARYMTLKGADGKTEYTTPSSIFLLGLVGQISKSFSVVGEISARNTMVSDTIDEQAIDASLRLGTHF